MNPLHWLWIVPVGCMSLLFSVFVLTITVTWIRRRMRRKQPLAPYSAYDRKFPSVRKKKAAKFGFVASSLKRSEDEIRRKISAYDRKFPSVRKKKAVKFGFVVSSLKRSEDEIRRKIVEFLRNARN